MAFTGVSRALIERILHDSSVGLRLIHDIPILTDVWSVFGADPVSRVNLLLSPADDVTPARAARVMVEKLAEADEARPPAFGKDTPRLVSPLQSFVTASLNFLDLIEVIGPLLGLDYEILTPTQAAAHLRSLGDGARREKAIDPASRTSREEDRRNRVSVLITLIQYTSLTPEPWTTFEEAAEGLMAIGDQPPPFPLHRRPPDKPRLLRRAMLNRNIERLGVESIRTVKADAARRLFEPGCSDLVWAVIDSGIDATHEAFIDPTADEKSVNKSRVLRSYDFSRLRRLTSVDILLRPDSEAYAKLGEDIAGWLAVTPTYPGDDFDPSLGASELLELLRQDVKHDRPLSWQVVERLLRVPHDAPPPEAHGTHVAGIMAADWKRENLEDYVGVCPELRLFDLRIIGETQGDTESAIIGALDFIRWINRQKQWRIIHGANLSIGMKHDVRTWACGQTPVCVACEETVSSGVCVVVAAGNDGWQSFLVGDNKRYDGYALASIMDPGNAQSVITVGATHREWPHLYGVSFFSSRGPTGDGRMKPDVLAPGEKIDGPLPFGEFGALDGTSMAAPHVSGVAALLMGRHKELQGRPADIKQILMETAIDLGRERSAQGAGLVDALAAMQRR